MDKISKSIVLFVLLSLALPIEWPWDKSSTSPNKPLPQATMKNLENADVNIYDFIDGGPCLIYFGHTKHHFSGNAIKYIDQLHQKYKNKRFKVIVVVGNNSPHIYETIREKIENNVIIHTGEANFLKDENRSFIKKLFPFMKSRKNFNQAALAFVNRAGIVVHTKWIKRNRTGYGWEEDISIDRLDYQINNLTEGEDINLKHGLKLSKKQDKADANIHLYSRLKTSLDFKSTYNLDIIYNDPFTNNNYVEYDVDAGLSIAYEQAIFKRSKFGGYLGAEFMVGRDSNTTLAFHSIYLMPSIVINNNLNLMLRLGYSKLISGEDYSADGGFMYSVGPEYKISENWAMQISNTWYKMPQKLWLDGIPSGQGMNLPSKDIEISYSKFAISIVYGFANKK